MIVLVARYRVKPGEMDTVLDGLREMQQAVASDEPACLKYEVGRSIDNVGQLLLIEHYRDRPAVDAHRTTPHFARIIEGTVVPRLNGRERELLELVIP